MTNCRQARLILAVLILTLTGSLTGAEETVILNRESYFSVYQQYGYYRYDPATLEKEKVGEKQLKRIEKYAKIIAKSMQKRGWRPDKEDWKQNAFVWRSRQGMSQAPPESWNHPDFDDSDWPRRRDIFLSSQTKVVKSFFRTWVDVKDPSASITLSMGFRGGAKVYLNGHEIASSHMKGGRVPAYPEGAYLAMPDELHPDVQKKGKRRIGYFKRSFGGSHRHKKDKDWRYAPGTSKVYLQKKAWDRILNLRNQRRIGPLVLPQKHLKKGANLLAIELQVADCGPHHDYNDAGERHTSNKWPHIDLSFIEVKADAAVAESTLSRQSGTRVWAEDIHMRIYNPDYLPAGTPAGSVKIVGARGGSYGGQIVVETSKPLDGLSVVVSDLKQTPSGPGKISARSTEVRYMLPHPLKRIGRDLGGRARHSIEYESYYVLERYLPLGQGKQKHLIKKRHAKLFENLTYYDHLTAESPKTLAANACQPIWISVNVPEDASPGTYEGSITVNASGGFSQTLPLEVEVVDWKMPLSKDFTTLVWAEQNPYGVAAKYKVKLWSEKHLKLVGDSLAQLGHISSDVLIIPVLINSEFGNDKDSPIKWIRQKDGRFRFDYTNLDNYLDLAIQHWGTPRFISFHVLHGGTFNPMYVMVSDEARGESEEICLGSTKDSVDNHREEWGQFATSLYNHMKARGLHRSMYWGLEKDLSTYPTLQPLLAEFAPEVKWVMTTHMRLPTKYNKVVADVYANRRSIPGKKAANGLWMGWKSPALCFSNSRSAVKGTAYFLAGYHPPFAHRPWAETVLSRNYRGIGRFGADNWGMWHKSFPATVSQSVGFGIRDILWPGKTGPEGSVRLEILREGLQEAEAKIFLERAVDSGLVAQELSERIGQLIKDRYLEVGHIQRHYVAPYYNSDNHQGWRARSQELYRMAALVAGKIDVAKLAEHKSEQAAEEAPGLSLLLDRESFKVPASRSTRLSFALHNSTAKPVEWKAKPGQPWLNITPLSGKVEAGKVQGLRVQLKAPGKPGDKLSAGIVLQDKAGKPLSEAVIPLVLGKAPKLLPKGRRIALSALPETITYKKEVPGNSKDKKLKFHQDQSLLMKPKETITFQLEGSGIHAFSAEAILDAHVAYTERHQGAGKRGGMYCEVFVDGKLREKSRILKLTKDSSHMLTVTGLEKAKTLRIVSHKEKSWARLHYLSWREPTFYVGK